MTYNPQSFSALPKLCSDNYLRAFYSQKIAQIHMALTVNIIKNIIYSIYKTTIQSISILLLLHTDTFLNVNRVAQNYLERYKNTFRGSFTRNYIGSCFYDNDIYINKIAILNLYILLLCSERKGIYTLWLYLILHKIQKSIPT